MPITQPGPETTNETHFFNPLYEDPTDHGHNGRSGRNLWFNLTNLRESLTTAGITWLEARTDIVPDNGYGKLPQCRRLWNCEGPVRLLHGTDNYIGVACGEDGQPAEIWAAPTLEAFMASRNYTENDAEIALGNAWEEILDAAAANSGSTIVIGFAVDGCREPELDLD